MSIMETSPSFAPFPVLGGIRAPSFVSRLVGEFAALRARRSGTRRARRSVSDFTSFNDHMLGDVGLTRVDVERAGANRSVGLVRGDMHRIMGTPRR